MSIIFEQQRPKLTLPMTTVEKIMNLIGYSLFIVSFGFLIAQFGNMADTVPTHINGAGEVDGWGSKWSLLLLPAIAIGTMILLEIFERKPHLHNYPDRFSVDKASTYYQTSRQTLNYVKNI